MDDSRLWMELEEAFDRLSCGLNAVKLMVLGLEDAQSPYADGFYAVSCYLQEAQEEVGRLLKAVSTVRGAA